MDQSTIEFDVSLDDIIYSGGMEGFNEILDSRMADQDRNHYATDITYEPVGVDGNIVTIRATYIPEPYDEDEDEDGAE